MVNRTKSPSEIREEFERLKKEREERQLEQRTNPKGIVVIGLNATDLFDSYRYQEDDSLLPKIEISTMQITQSISQPVSSSDAITLTGHLSTQNGIGNGHIITNFRKVLSEKSWSEIEFIAGHGPILRLKGYRNLTKHVFGSAQCILIFTPYGVKPGTEFGLWLIDIVLKFNDFYFIFFSNRQTIK